MLYSDSATNLLPLHGRLPLEKDQLLSIIGEYKSKDYTELNKIKKKYFHTQKFDKK
jgi:hypothetical protein